MRTPADRGRWGGKMGHFLQTSFMDDPLLDNADKYATFTSSTVLNVHFTLTERINEYDMILDSA